MIFFGKSVLKLYGSTAILFLCNAGFLRAQECKESVYFDTSFLSRYDEVSQMMKEKEGFVEGFFTTHDNVSINYLWLQRKNARYTMIFCSGFFPGRKEGLATFYALLPSDCNLLFFDARGHGKSTGQCMKRVWRYGLHEYKDVIGAICWVHKQQPACPIVIYGLCAGAFHAVRALLYMKSEGILELCFVKGLIFDSGWSSIKCVAHTAPKSHVLEWAAQRFENHELFSTMLCKLLGYCIDGLYYALVYPALYVMGDQTNLVDYISAIHTPIFYIHAEHDSYASIEPVKLLAQKTKHATCWWIAEQSKHACHHLKLKDQYRERLLDFVTKIVAQDQVITTAR